MRRRFYLLLLFGVVFAFPWLPARSAPPPLVVNKSAPLLLLEEPKSPQAKPAKGGADNEPCFVCHGDYREEPIVTWHAVEKIGCIKCHGSSEAHRADEDNITPPEKMYPAAKIDAACRDCHEEHDAPAREVIAAWQKRCPAKTSPDQIVCTDCHGRHRRPFRVVQWDKTTGKLVVIKPKSEREAAKSKKDK